MKNRSKFIYIAAAALLALVFAGSGLTTMATAAGLPAGAAVIYLPVAAAVAICALGAWSTGTAIASAVLFIAAAGGFLATHAASMHTVRAVISSWSGTQVDAETLQEGGRLLMTCGAFFAGAIFFAMLSRVELATPAIMLLASMLVGSHALSRTASLGAAVPGLIAAAAAFALTGGNVREETGLRALIPSALAVALALLLAPAEGTTSRTMEQAAIDVRAIIEQYINFTRERVAFSINEEGYDHGGETEDGVVAMLGGPAEPHDDAVMTVQTPRDVLLRGAIRTTYTGYSWVDLDAKNRYLYYDPTHRSNRSAALDMDRPAPSDAFESTDVSVRMLREATSTLFVPGRLSEFTMDLKNAVYYNTAGEMFLARRIEPGDTYSLKALLPLEGEGLRRAVIEAQQTRDDSYQAILQAHTALPAGIEDGVYALTAQVISGAQTPYDRATAIQSYLRRNMRYALDVEYPPLGRDFVSWFVLDSREGYCSYFASAMAVMGRMAGLPTRYVEGYAARPDGGNGPLVLTGWDAHAWCEIYFNGIGWIPFDATSGAAGYGRSGAPEDGNGQGDGGQGDDGGQDGDGADMPNDQPTPTPAPEGEGDGTQPTPTPDPGAGDAPEDGSQDQAPDDGGDGEDPFGDAPEQDPFDQPPQDDPDWPDAPDAPDQAEEPRTQDAPDDHRPWLWIVLALLALAALIALLARWIKSRLRRSDPNWLCRQTRSASEAAMIAYRANLTALGHMGQSPTNGETPEAFVARIKGQFDSADYAAFVRAVANHRYGKKALTSQDVQAGLNAYNAFVAGMGRRERFKFNVSRALHGLGDFESIP